MQDYEGMGRINFFGIEIWIAQDLRKAEGHENHLGKHTCIIPPMRFKPGTLLWNRVFGLELNPSLYRNNV